jgi:hypothetical protein
MQKTGFMDGDVHYDILERLGLLDVGGTGEHGLTFYSTVLCVCVERYLLPLIPAVRTYRIGTAHNPIRTERALTTDEKTVSATISAEQIEKVAKELLAGTIFWRDGA